jgi:hypothetical protein
MRMKKKVIEDRSEVGVKNGFPAPQHRAGGPDHFVFHHGKQIKGPIVVKGSTGIARVSFFARARFGTEMKS